MSEAKCDKCGQPFGDIAYWVGEQHICQRCACPTRTEELEAEVARQATEYATLLAEYQKLADDYKRSELDVLHNLQAAEAAVTKEQADEHGKLVLEVFTLRECVTALEKLAGEAAERYMVLWHRADKVDACGLTFEDAVQADRLCNKLRAAAEGGEVTP